MPKRLWLEVNRQDLRVITPDMERRFQVGHQVGAFAQDLEDNGLLIEHETNLTAALQATREALSRYPDRPLFEPAFQHDGLLVRIDLLVPQGAGFQLVEVKSTGSVKEQHYYHPDMKGSWSIKAVLPTVAPDLDYASLGEVQDGTSAQFAYLELIDPDIENDRKQQLEAQLREYCKLDTLALVRLARFLARGGTRQ